MVRKTFTTLALAAVLGVAMAACSSGSSGSSGNGGARSASPSTTAAVAPSTTADSSAPTTTGRAASFSANVDNPWFPLKPGTTLVYRGSSEGEPTLDRFTATRETKVVAGVPCRVVVDRVYTNGKLSETTRDYYSQDAKGNVWYFGEDTAELNRDGSVATREGSWLAGRAGARPGLFMPAHPRVGESHQQEHFVGHAEDWFQVVSLSSSVSVPYRSFGDAVLTKEWTPLEPGVLDHKYYAQGIGTIKETTVKGPQEDLVLVAVKTG